MSSAIGFSPMRQLVPLTNNRSLIASFSLAPRKSRHWVVFLTESGAEFQSGNRAELKALLGPRMGAKFNYLVVNKPGLEPGRVNKAAFESSFRRSLRISDTLATLKAIIPPQDKICLVGYSEGAYLAPEVASRDRRVKSVTIIGGGTRGWLKEEVSNARNSREKAALVRQVKKISQNTHSMERWNGFSYATWNSYRSDKTLQALSQIRVPVLAILGKRDTVIDLKSTLNDLTRLAKKKNIQTHLLKDCGHTFTNHWADVRRELRRFLENN